MMSRKYNIVMLGAGGVGKSALVRQFLYGKWHQQYKPTVEQYYRHLMRFTPKICHPIEILDTAGNYQFPAMRELAIRSGLAFMVVFAVDDEDSLKTAIRLRNEIVDIKGDQEVPVVLVGNKADVPERKVSAVSAKRCARLHFNHNYIETSAKYNINIEELFTDISKEQLNIEIPAKAMKGVGKERNVKTIFQRILKRNAIHKNNEDKQLKTLSRRCSSESSNTFPSQPTKSDGLFMRLSRTMLSSFGILKRRKPRQIEQETGNDSLSAHGSSEMHMGRSEDTLASVDDTRIKYELVVPKANVTRSQSIPKSTRYFEDSPFLVQQSFNDINQPSVRSMLTDADQKRVRCYNLPRTQPTFSEMWECAEVQFADTERKL
ncbi:unnamed protein product [Owenia fusiformis]|uniref:Uncharacterized protein n=1 Tax=Owenia fusiformis TaxID=6347 RepID=A0A8J1UMM1_OWEFU|nr:unnamed protein product [Owenia fusiformis]